MSPTHPNNQGFLTPEQRAKLQSELDVVQSNMTVLGEMLYEVKPGEEQPDELELLQVVNSIKNWWGIICVWCFIQITFKMRTESTCLYYSIFVWRLQAFNISNKKRLNLDKHMHAYKKL